MLGRNLKWFLTLSFVGVLACGSTQDLGPGSPSIRSLNGAHNNLQHPAWGSAGTRLARLAPPVYGDGISTLGGRGRPGPRVLSNELFAQQGAMPNGRGLSAMLWQWGQFIAHDMDLTPPDLPVGDTNPGQPAFIPIPAGDPFFDPLGTGSATIPFFRSVFDGDTGTGPSKPREQINVVSAWIDASMVYGSDPLRADWLRTGEGGKLKTSAGGFLPFNDGTLANDPDRSTDLFVAGDVRANEQVGLSALHILFVREHNRLAEILAASHPEWSDEEIYQKARKFVGAFLEVITFQEFLPALLGPQAPGSYGGYDADMDPSVLNEFSTAFFRLGHTMISSELLRLQESGADIPQGPLAVRDAFFNPGAILEEGGIDPILRGLIRQPLEEVDTQMVDDLRNFLFGPPGAGGLDLAAMNIQRGRDHGLADYNTLRMSLGLPTKTAFDEITSDPALALKLETLYGDVHDLDPWVGALAEDPLSNSSVGELLTTAIVLQFERLRSADRLWCENDSTFSEDEMRQILATRLSHIIRRNTAVQNIPEEVFFVP